MTRLKWVVVGMLVCGVYGCTQNGGEVNAIDEPFVPLDSMDSGRVTPTDSDTRSENTQESSLEEMEPVAADPPKKQERVAPTKSAERVHVVAKGDSLYQLARQYYGNSKRWRDIYNANRDKMADPNALSVGMKLVIPQ